MGRALMQAAMRRAVHGWGAKALYTHVEADNEVGAGPCVGLPACLVLMGGLSDDGHVGVRKRVKDHVHTRDPGRASGGLWTHAQGMW